MNFKNVFTLTALFSFSALILSGVIALLFNRRPWPLYISLGILFGISYAVQTAFELKSAKAQARKTGKPRAWLTANSCSAILLTGWVVLGSLLHWPPFSSLEAPDDSGPTEEQVQQRVFEETAETKPPLPEKPPLFYSGRSMRRLSGKYEMDLSGIIAGLEKLGIESSPDWTFREIAEHNDMDTKSVYEAVLQVR